MLTGYNTDVPFEGVTYHVQTEDKGLKNPIILSLIYQGGTILGAKRTAYNDLIADGKVDESRLAKAIEKQHQIMLAAISGGKLPQLIEKLNQQAEQSGEAKAKKESKEKSSAQAPAAKPNTKGTSVSAAAAPAEKPGSSSSRIYNLKDLTSDDAFSFDEILDEFLKSDRPHEKLSIEWFSPTRLVAGEKVNIRASVLYDSQWPAVGSAIRVQIVGTTIKPQTYTTTCDQSGTFTMTLKMPEFHAGTAALIITATEPKGQEAEFKLLIRRR
jgi:hypothetical protein